MSDADERFSNRIAVAIMSEKHSMIWQSIVRRFALVPILFMAPFSTPAEAEVLGAWKGTITINGLPAALYVSITSQAGKQISGYLYIHSIGNHPESARMCDSFVGSADEQAGQMALIADPDRRAVAANGGNIQGMRRLSMSGRLTDATWRGRVSFTSIFSDFSVIKTQNRAVKPPGCLQKAQSLDQSAWRTALVAERAKIVDDIARDNQAYRMLFPESQQADARWTCTKEVFYKEVWNGTLEGLVKQLIDVFSKNPKRLEEAVDWATKLGDATRGKPLSKSSSVGMELFKCIARETAEKRIPFVQRRIAQEKRIRAIDDELSATPLKITVTPSKRGR